MINLKPYDKDCLDFHKTVVSKKNKKKDDPNYKERLEALSEELEEPFKNYLNLIDKDGLISLTTYGYSGQKKADLLSLYRYKSKVLQDLNLILTTKDDRKFNTCQMCTVEPVGSFDHIVPKEKFPEFVVNPVNLFPCCQKCNGQKGDDWQIDGERAFLNLYYDLLPDIQYLKVKFNAFPIPTFAIDGTSVDDEFFRLISSHYQRLDLFKRFRENSNEVIDPLVSYAKHSIPQLGLDRFREIVRKSTDDDRKRYGINHWKSILKLALVNHADFPSLV